MLLNNCRQAEVAATFCELEFFPEKKQPNTKTNNNKKHPTTNQTTDKESLIFCGLKLHIFHISILLCLCTAELLKEKLTYLIGTTGLNGNLLDKVKT